MFFVVCYCKFQVKIHVLCIVKVKFFQDKVYWNSMRSGVNVPHSTRTYVAEFTGSSLPMNFMWRCKNHRCPNRARMTTWYVLVISVDNSHKGKRHLTQPDVGEFTGSSSLMASMWRCENHRCPNQARMTSRHQLVISVGNSHKGKMHAGARHLLSEAFMPKNK